MTFTKEQLIERCEEAIASLKPCTGLAETKSLACFEIALSALASLEAERGKVRRFDIDVCDMVEDLDGEYVLFEDVLPYLNQYADYTHPQPLTTSERSELENYRNAQQVVTEQINNITAVEPDWSDPTNREPGIWAYGWNECRAAMQSGTVKDGLVESSVDTAQVQFESLAGNSPEIPDCWCRTCRPVSAFNVLFIVCSECGNKRCPHANDHRNVCTGSNEPGQEGSAYPAAPQQEAE